MVIKISIYIKGVYFFSMLDGVGCNQEILRVYGHKIGTAS